tara:strand:+ start:225 stop:722 length:498 start_codon:yes stop_codon:yes gene_type:complete
MEEARQKTDLLYSPRQIEIAIVLAGPVCTIYMLVKNYNILEQYEFSRNVKYLGSFLFLSLLVAIAYIPYDIPNGAFQASCLIFVWAILKKYHMTKDEISDSSALDFRSNWTVVLVTLLGLIITLGIGTIVSILVIIAADVGLLPMTDSFVSTLEEKSAEGIIFWR